MHSAAPPHCCRGPTCRRKIAASAMAVQTQKDCSPGMLVTAPTAKANTSVRLEAVRQQHCNKRVAWFARSDLHCTACPLPGDCDGDPGLLERPADALPRLAPPALPPRVGQALQDHKHVVNADTQAEQRQRGVHRRVEESCLAGQQYPGLDT